MSYHLELREKINEFLFDNLEISSNDPLKSISSSGVFSFKPNVDLSDEEFNFFYRNFKQLITDTGINPVCISYYAIRLEKNSNWTPIFLKETIYNNSLKTFEPDGDEFLNPYLKYKLKLDDKLEILNLELFCDFLDSISLKYELKDCTHIGLFHPFRFELIKELSELKEVETYSSDLASILNLEPPQDHNLVFDWNDIKLFSLNSFQTNALNFLKTDSMVVHGPPGTGKSQLIASVIGQCLFNDYSAIFVSEKKTAIQAVLSKLKSVNLDKFVLTYHVGKSHRKKTIEGLKSTWDYLQNLNSNLPIIFDDHNYDEEIFFKNLFDLNQVIELKSLVHILEQGSVKNFNTYHVDNASTLELKFIMENLKAISSDDFKILQKVKLNEYNPFSLKKIINQLESSLKELNKIQKIEVKKDLDELVLLSLKLRKFKSNYYLKYENVLVKNKLKFQKVFKKWKILNSEIEHFEKVFSHWKKFPNSSEIDNFYLQEKKKTLFQAVRRRKLLKKFTDINSSIALKELKEIEKYHSMKNKLFNLEKSFQNLDIHDLKDLGLIHELIDRFEEADWIRYKSMNQQEIDFYENSQPKIFLLNSVLDNYFKLLPDENIHDFLKLIIRLEDSISNVKSFSQKLSKSTFELISKCTSIDEVIFNLSFSFLKSKFKNQELPSKKIMNINLKKLCDKLKIDELKNTNSANKVQLRILNKFNSYQSLIVSGNKKLNEEEIDLKNKLKSGKKILIKEFSKKRNYKSLRELMDSDAKYWICQINPILMLNPFQLSSFSPMKKDLFSLGIIDEASQMPVSHALGTIQRCKRLLIAGDENQIEPLSFFKNKSNETSILHQAKYHFTGFPLRYHYRSESESLITYSNNYFYQGKLKALETYNKIDEKCLFDHYVKGGTFEDNKNLKEAKEFAKLFYRYLLKNKHQNKLTYAIIAFSQAQLNQILNEISKLNSAVVDNLENKNQLIVKTLDQVQGEEADIVFISFGYAKNLNNKFDMRFGPVNLAGGEKRLNVLFSRAKKQIHFFSSVRLIDFKKSENAGVIALKNWFEYLENHMEKGNKKTKFINDEISFYDILNISTTSEDLVHLLKTYHSRGWNFNFL